MKVRLTRALHEPNGDTLPEGTVVDRADAEALIAIGGAHRVDDKSVVTIPHKAPPSGGKTTRSP